MGVCWCKESAPTEGPNAASGSNAGSNWRTSSGLSQTRAREILPCGIIDKLILEMLSLVSTFIDNEDDSPLPLMKLHVIAEKEEGWIQVVMSMIRVIPLEDPLGASTISIVFDDCPLPTREAVIEVGHVFQVGANRPHSGELNTRFERNICAVFGCIADKLAGPNSMAILTNDLLDYLVTLLVQRRESCVVLFALIAIEKFSQTTENRLTFKTRIEQEPVNPLLILEQLAESDDNGWRQVGFCAKWSLDNLFLVEGRKLSYEEVDMSNINVILNSNDVSEYLKISANGLEARCDSYSFESVRCTFQVDEGCWYYEATLITEGVMQLGWATKLSHFMNYEGFGIGDDLFSVSFDGCRRLVWYQARAESVDPIGRQWKAGDVLGCLLDLERREAIFSINNHRLPPCQEIFKTSWEGFFAAASFMPFQQCRFNFGSEPFKYPPTDREYTTFNEHGYLTDEEKTIIPRRLYMQKLQMNTSYDEDACTLCYDDTACCILEPCLHGGFCSLCTAQLKDCPLCRGPIEAIRREDL